MRNEHRCRIVDGKDVEYTNVTLTYLVDELGLKVKCNLYMISAVSTPPLPQGSYLTNDGTLYLYLKNMQPKTDYVFSLVYDSGNATIPFSITGVQCKHGDITVMNSLGTTNLTVSYNNTQIFTGGKDMYYCIPFLPIAYHMECIRGPSLPYCTLTIRHGNGELLFHRQVLNGKTIDGEFEAAATRPPQTSMQRFIAYPANNKHFIYPDFDGIVGNVTIHTEGYQSLIYNGLRFELQDPHQGVELYTITASNAFGSTSFDMTICIEACPEGMNFLCLDSQSVQPPEYYEITSVNGQYIHSFYEAPTNCFCSPNNEIKLHMASSNGRGYATTSPIVMSDLKGVVSEFHIPQGFVEDTRTVRYLEVLAEGSKFRFFKGAAVAGWNTPSFNDAAWEEGVKGQWGAFPPEHSAFFRTRVALGKTEGYEGVSLTAVVNGLCDVYLDGALVSHINATETLTHRKFLPLSLFGKQSVLAVEVSSPTQDAIDFDMSLHLASSMCLLQSVGGTATSDDPNPSPLDTPIDAFSLHSYMEWKTALCPVTLDYHFENDDLAVVNKITIRNMPYGIPRKFLIQGLVDSDVVDLYSYEGDRFMTYGTEQIFSFENTRAFSTYRFIFEERRTNGTFNIGGIRLLYCPPSTCPKKWRTPLSPLGTNLLKSCPMGSAGVYARRCDDVDGSVQWVDDKSTCLPSRPHKGVSFVDWSFTVTHLYYTDWLDVKEKVVAMLLKHITVTREQITFVMVRDMTEDEIPITQVYVRFTVNSHIGDHLQYTLDISRGEFDAWVKSEVNKAYDASISKTVKLHNPTNYVVVCICCLAVIVFVVLAFGWYRSNVSVKEMKRKMVKRVENPETGANHSLLMEVWSVCYNKAV